MGAFLDKPKTEKESRKGYGNGLYYGLSSMQGWRVDMEDNHCALVSINDEEGVLKNWSFFAVFDGHAGVAVSTYCAQHMLKQVLGNADFVKGVRRDVPGIEDIRKGIVQSFLMLDTQMRKLPELNSFEERSGTTAVCAFIAPTHIFIANCGDSRAFVCQNGYVSLSTVDHKPSNALERDRIQKAGGTVVIQRVNGALAVSRALGDFEYKSVEGRGQLEQLVSPEPDIFVQRRDHDTDQFLIIACDGVWDVFTNQDMCDFVLNRLGVTDDLASVCNQIVDTALYKGSRDNISCVLVTFPAAPKPKAELIEKEKRLEAMIEAKMKELIEKGDCKEFPVILQLLSDEKFPGLPPGGGLCAKRAFIESVYRKLLPEKAHVNLDHLHENTFM